MPPCQSVYKVGHSTETALVKVQFDILLNIDQQKVSQLVLIDLSSVFDTVDHNVLLLWTVIMSPWNDALVIYQYLDARHETKIEPFKDGVHIN